GEKRAIVRQFLPMQLVGAGQDATSILAHDWKDQEEQLSSCHKSSGRVAYRESGGTSLSTGAHHAVEILPSNRRCSAAASIISARSTFRSQPSSQHAPKIESGIEMGIACRVESIPGCAELRF